MYSKLKARLQDLLNSAQPINLQRVSGGDISDAFNFSLDGSSYFLKVNTAGNNGFFEAESIGLKEISKVVKTPQVLGQGVEGEHSFLLLNWIDSGIKTDNFWTHFGEQLAGLHALKAEHFGFWSHNYIGSLPQLNVQTDDWPNFFAEYRIDCLVEVAFNQRLLKQHHLHGFKSLEGEYESLFPNCEPCLLHGDLWSGNFLCDQHGESVLIDPAVYYGHPEMELAFTSMFGGFSQEFYESYFSINPQIPGFKDRIAIYNLYPTLVHLILFGPSYLSGIESVLRRFRR